MKIDALGFLEVRGLVAAIEAADAMLKAADVKLIRSHQVDPRFFTLVVEGDLAACRAAVDAGMWTLMVPDLKPPSPALAARVREILPSMPLAARRVRDLLNLDP